MLNHPPRITIAALKGGSGKTIVSLGLTAAWQNKGHRIAPFKKGPDFIDADWLALAASRPCHNLDPFMMTHEQMLQSFLVNSMDAELSIIEGNRGLFDGLDLNGCCSTAELGKLLKSPVVIIVDVTMCTRTIAALVLGCQRFDEDLQIAGVLLNRVAGNRQETLVRNSIERYCGIPVLGSVPKLKNLFPERHMGLVPRQEREHAEKAILWTKEMVENNIELDALWSLAHSAPPLEGNILVQKETAPDPKTYHAPRIGFIRDRSFWFYYPENLEQLEKSGAMLLELNALEDGELPDLDALYIGGGFPETQAEALTENRAFREALKKRIQGNLPVYAECGGLLYLGETLIVEGKAYPMVGALPLSFVMEKKPQGHGYTVLEVDTENPYHRTGDVLRGHEFHYSRPIIPEGSQLKTVFKVVRGRGLDGVRDGLLNRKLLATYTHIHGAGNQQWGKNLFMAALGYMQFKKRNFCMDDK